MEAWFSEGVCVGAASGGGRSQPVDISLVWRSSSNAPRWAAWSHCGFPVSRISLLHWEFFYETLRPKVQGWHSLARAWNADTFELLLK